MHRTFTLHTEEPDGVVAKLEADTVPFISLGEASQAVVLRLQSRLPRIKVASPHRRGRGTDGDSL